MARIKLNYTGKKSVEMRSRVRVSAIAYIPTVILSLNGLLIFLMARAFVLHLHHIFRIFLYSSIVVLFADATIVVYFYSLLIKTRRQIRCEFNIPVDRGCEDTCLSLGCTPCVLMQMGQHTADYTTYVGNCCTDTGLSRHLELKFPYEIQQEV